MIGGLPAGRESTSMLTPAPPADDARICSSVGWAMSETTVYSWPCVAPAAPATVRLYGANCHAPANPSTSVAGYGTGA